MHGKHDLAYLIDSCPRMYITDNTFIKHSKNIIDLIEVGDIVEIYDVLHNDIICIWSDDMLKALKEDIENGIRIKSILTHEQFEQAQYRIEKGE